MEGVDEVEEGVEGCHGNVREGQVDDEVVGDSSHPSVSQNNPDYCDVPSDGHQDDKGVGYGPQRHLREREKGEVRKGEGWRGEERRLQVRRAGKRREKMEREGGVRRGGNVMDKIKEYNILI